MIRKEEQKGITLISLVITIIVLLILSVVAISFAVDANGLFAKTKQAAEEWNTSVGNEEEIINDLLYYGEINWNKILKDATANPEKYKHPDQRSTNGDIGIGTDGKPVNLDLWLYDYLDYDGGFSLRGANIQSGIYFQNSYANSDIVNGKIQGTVPQYIKLAGENEFKPVIYMQSTFAKCTNLIEAPKIPDTVKSMSSTFASCTNLQTASTIPSSVGRLENVFYKCSNLTGSIEINANKPSCSNCFKEASTATGTNLVVTGSSTNLDEIIATKSSNSNITKGT